MAQGKQDATADLKEFGSQLSSQISQERMNWRFLSPHPSAAITSHRHPTSGLNSVYRNGNRLKAVLESVITWVTPP